MINPMTPVLLRMLKLIAVIIAVMTIAACGGNTALKKWEPEKRAQAHVALGLDYLQRGKFEVAREELDLALDIDSNLDSAHHGKGLLLAQLGFIDEAKSSFARAVRINKSNFIAANDYGIYLCQNGEMDKGISQLKKVESKSNNQLLMNTLLGLGICYFNQNALDDAQGYFRRVLEVSPRLHQALLPMSEISYQKAEYLSARAFIERYLATSIVSERALVVAANTEIKLKDIAAARQYASRLRRLYPSSTEIDQYRSLLK